MIKKILQRLEARGFGILPARVLGQTYVEYALVLFLITVAAAVVLLVLGGEIQDVLASMNKAFKGSRG